MRPIDADALMVSKKWENCTCPAQVIHSAPTIEVEPVKHGKWKLHDDGSGTCNQCHHTQKAVWDDDNWQNYCGVCGAKMDSEDQ